MPWKETSPMEQRLACVVQWAKHETSMAELCRAFQISRQTGYELVAQFQGINPVLALIELALILAWKNAGFFGLDFFVLRKFGPRPVAAPDTDRAPA